MTTKNKKVFEIEVTETIVRRMQVVADNKDKAFDKYLDMDKDDVTVTYAKDYSEITNHMRYIGDLEYDEELESYERSNRDIVITI